MAQNAIAVQYDIITVPVHFGSKNLDIPLAPQPEHPQESRDKGVLDDFFPQAGLSMKRGVRRCFGQFTSGLGRNDAAFESILSLRYALGHIDVLHAQQLNQTIIVRFRGSDHE